MRRSAAFAAVVLLLVPVLLLQAGCGRKRVLRDPAAEALAVANAVAEAEAMAAAMEEARERHLAEEKAKAEAEERSAALARAKAEEEAARAALEALLAEARETGPPRPEGKTPVELFEEAKELFWTLKYREALEKAAAARKAMPHHNEALLLEAKLRYELDEPSPGLDLMEEAFARKIAGLDALHTYVRWAAEKGLAGRAISTVEKLRTGGSFPAHETGVALFWLYFRQGEYGEAAKLYAAIESSPDGALFRTEAACLKLLAGDVEGAKRLAEDAGQGNTAMKLALAEMERAQGRVASAEAILRELLEKNDRDYAAKVDLGILKLTQGDARAAAKLFEEAAVEMPERPEAETNLGIARRMLGDHEGAKKAYEKVLAAFPENPRAMKNLAILLEKYFGENTGALSLYRRYLKIVPEDRDAERYAKSVEKTLEKATGTGTGTAEEGK